MSRSEAVSSRVTSCWACRASRAVVSNRAQATGGHGEGGADAVPHGGAGVIAVQVTWGDKFIFETDIGSKNYYS